MFVPTNIFADEEDNIQLIFHEGQFREHLSNMVPTAFTYAYILFDACIILVGMTTVSQDESRGSSWSRENEKEAPGTHVFCVLRSN